MSSDSGFLVTLSDSSDDDSPTDVLTPSASNRRSAASPVLPTTASLTISEPATQDAADLDWVRDFTPTVPYDGDQKRTLLNPLDDDDDDDNDDDDNGSVVDLISQNPSSSQPTLDATVSPAATDPAQQSQPAGLKRTRVPTRPKCKLPLVVAPKLDESVVLLQGADDNLDLSGDVGAVGRVKVQGGNLFLDIKGVIYRATTVPCNSMCMVSVGDDEAKITAVLDQTVSLACERNLFTSDEVVLQGEPEEGLYEESTSSSAYDARKDSKFMSEMTKKRKHDVDENGDGPVVLESHTDTETLHLKQSSKISKVK